MVQIIVGRPKSLLSRLATTLLLAVACIGAYGQGTFTVNGRLKIDGGDLAGTRVVVYRDGVKERTITANLNRFSLDLALNSNYVFSFEKAGFVSKKLQFDTRLPAGTVARTYTPFEFAVSLFKQYDNVNIVVFNQPVGMIRYEVGTGDFDYDTDYTKSIQSQLQKALAEVELQQKEEARNASADAKRVAAEEKLKAKNEAEAAKQADLAAKAELARVETERKEEEKRQAELRKAEQDARAAAAAKTPTPAPVPVAPPPPPVAASPAPKPTPAPAPVPARVQRAPEVRPIRTVSSETATAVAGSDDRRSGKAVLAEEPSPVRAARSLAGEDLPIHAAIEDVEVIRDEQLIIEPNKVMTVVRLERGTLRTEYRKVIHKWGTTYYFKDGQACSQQVYDREALGDRLVDAMPRGKMD